MTCGLGIDPGLPRLVAVRAVVVLEDLLAEVDALVADVDTRACDELAHLVLALAAEGAARVAPAVFAFGHWSMFPTIVHVVPIARAA